MSRCECAKEGEQQSSHSPGIVTDGEPIVYALVEPLTGSVKAISKSQLKKTEVSVCRAAHSTAADAKNAIVDTLLAKDPSRTDNGFLWAECAEIRSIKLGSSEIGAFCVIDDGLPAYSAHAHIGYSDPPDEKLRSDREAARGNLLKLFQKRGVFPKWEGVPFPA